jgi:ribosome maturation factor RimP
MDKQELIIELENLLGDYLKSLGLDLVELICRYEGRGLVLRLLVDKPEGGITLEECAGLNSQMGNLLEEKNIIPERYILEVASPGLDRPLKARNDFRRCLNRRAKFFLSQALNGKIELDGAIKEAGPDTLSIETAAGLVQLSYSIINRAKQII